MPPAGQALQPGEQGIGQRRRCRLRERVLEPTLRIGFGFAFPAGGEVRQHPLPRIVSQLPVDQGREAVAEVVLGGGLTA
ncbi:hypothetical protein GCM10020000_28180 [Streptomyces olivoverticillatus]